MKKIAPYFLLLAILSWHCAGTAYQKMAEENPAQLLAKKDSLMEAGAMSPAVKKAIIHAHNSVGQAAMESKNFHSAISQFKAAVSISPKDTLSQYNLYLSEGQFLYKRGKKDGLWDAIENYHKAARLKPEQGEPYFHIGNAYYKIGDKDFDLMIESYEKAISLSMSESLLAEAESALENAKSREKKLKDFWN